NGVALEIPPLRTRQEEIAPLARHFAEVRAAALGLPAAPEIDPDALALLAQQPLPGNARELRNLIERAMLLAEPGKPLLAEHLMIDPTKVPEPRVSPAPASVPALIGDDDEKRVIIAALEECAGNQTRAAKHLGITRRALIVRLERYGIARPRQIV